jgi:hypothetical protein
MPRWTEVILVAAIVAAFFYGRHVGVGSVQAALAKAQIEVFQAAELASRKETERLVAEAARADLALQLEDQARAEPPAPAACLPVSRVLRLNKR